MTSTVMSVKNEDIVGMVRHRDGQMSFHIEHIWLNQKRYTVRGLESYFINEVFRKNSQPVLRTASKRFRAGTRRTKRLARARR